MAAFVFLFLGLSLAVVWVTEDYKKVHDEHAEIFFKDIDLINNELTTTLNNLTQLNIQQCDEHALIAMRRSMFKNYYIKDIGFLNGRTLLCTTGVGLLTAPVTTKDYDFTTANGLGININKMLRLFDTEVNATIVQRGNINVVIDNKNLLKSLPKYMASLITYQYNIGEFELIKTSSDMRIDLNHAKYNFNCISVITKGLCRSNYRATLS